MKHKLALFGISGQIAQSIVPLLQERFDVIGYARDPVASKKLTSLDIEILPYSELERHQFYGIINAAGPGDPATHRKLGKKIFQVTDELDLIALEYLNKNPETNYIYLSTGAVESFFSVTHSSYQLPSPFPESGNWYAFSKLFCEFRHRSMPHLKIWDLRIFGYFSRYMSLDSGFLLAEVTRCLLKGEVLQTSEHDFERDYIDEFILARAITSLLDHRPSNQAINLLTSSPINKFDMLEYFSAQYGLKYKIVNSRLPAPLPDIRGPVPVFTISIPETSKDVIKRQIESRLALDS